MPATGMLMDKSTEGRRVISSQAAQATSLPDWKNKAKHISSPFRGWFRDVEDERTGGSCATRGHEWSRTNLHDNAAVEDTWECVSWGSREGGCKMKGLRD